MAREPCLSNRHVHMPSASRFDIPSGADASAFRFACPGGVQSASAEMSQHFGETCTCWSLQPGLTVRIQLDMAFLLGKAAPPPPSRRGKGTLAPRRAESSLSISLSLEQHMVHLILASIPTDGNQMVTGSTNSCFQNFGTLTRGPHRLVSLPDLSTSSKMPAERHTWI